MTARELGGATAQLTGDGALAGMSPLLAEAFQRWYPFCRESVLDTVERIGGREFLAGGLGAGSRGVELTDRQYGMLRSAWLTPYRSYHERGGKRLRPFLVCVCVEAHGGDPTTMPGMVALPELIHAASLVLDDNADDSPLRRGGPTAHRMVGVRVSSAMASSWLNACFEILGREDIGISREAADQLVDRIAWEHWASGLGQTVDTTWPWLGRFDYEPEQYLQAVVYRSTSYTYRLPLTIGAFAAGATAEQRGQWEALGEEIGLAFQVLDDILDVQRQDDRWGKELAEDLTQGKVTLQVLLALRRATAADHDRLVDILTSHTRDPDVLAEAVSIMERTGAFDAARDVATGHIRRAREIVDGMDFVAGQYRTMMHDFIDYVVRRTW